MGDDRGHRPADRGYQRQIARVAGSRPDRDTARHPTPCVVGVGRRQNEPGRYLGQLRPAHDRLISSCSPTTTWVHVDPPTPKVTRVVRSDGSWESKGLPNTRQ